MLARVMSLGISGINGFPVAVEVDRSGGMPGFDVVGLPDASVKESRERVRSALRNSGMEYPVGHYTINLAPADMKKEGPSFDLPIAVGVLVCAEAISQSSLDGVMMSGELALSGAVNMINGALPMAIAARELGYKRLILPRGNADEARCISGIDIIPVDTIADVMDCLNGTRPIKPLAASTYDDLISAREYSSDFADVHGQRAAKRALEIAAAGSHNVIMVGEPGSGKTMLARCLPSILPDMTFEEALEVTRIHSVAGTNRGGGLMTNSRPSRPSCPSLRKHVSSSSRYCGHVSTKMFFCPRALAARMASSPNLVDRCTTFTRASPARWARYSRRLTASASHTSGRLRG